MSFKKEEEKLKELEQHTSDSEKSNSIPEFDVHGTALNDIHSLFES
ncbi:hypothetical protein ACWM35_13630 [Neobacillus sp. K501]